MTFAIAELRLAAGAANIRNQTTLPFALKITRAATTRAAAHGPAQRCSADMSGRGCSYVNLYRGHDWGPFTEESTQSPP